MVFPWYGVSVCLHVAAALAVIWLTPVGEMLMAQPKRPQRPEEAMVPERFNELIEKVREVNRRDLLDRLQRLDGVHAEMIRLGVLKVGELHAFEDNRIQDAPTRTMEMLAAVAKQQDALIALQRKGDLEAARFAQFSVAEACDFAAARLALASAPVGRSTAAITRAIAEQKKVADAIAKVWKPVYDAQILIIQTQRFSNYVSDRDGEMVEVRKGIAEHRRRAAGHKIEIDKLNKQIAQATKAGKKDAVKKLTRQLAREKAARAGALGSAASGERYGKSVLASKRQSEKDRDAATQKRLKIIAAGRKNLQATVGLQQRARKAVSAAIDALRAEIAKSPAKPVAPGPAAGGADRFAPPDRTGLDVPEIYNAGVKTERLIAEQYREIRAAKLAMLQDITLDEARPSVDVPTSVRPKLNEAILRKRIDSPEWIEPYRKEMKAAIGEMESMVVFAESLLRLAQDYVRDDNEGLELAMDMIESRMSMLAMENIDMPFADLSELMARMESLRELEFESALPDGEEGEEGPHAPHGLLALAPDEDVPESERHGSGLPSLGGLRDRKPKSLVGGRVVSSRGDPVEWMYVDSWYILGPLPNPGRKNIHRKFAPESAVDLDAVYATSDGRGVRWRFFQSAEPRVEMPDAQTYVIYYAYTELYFDKAADLWVAVGSDDRSDIWINNMKIWQSSDELKGWEIGEGLRKVHFRRGFNKVLYRIENGWGRMGFSMTIRTRRGK